MSSLGRFSRPEKHINYNIKSSYMVEAVDHVSIIGGGIMGSGIGQELALAGIDITIYDIDENAFDDSRDRVESGKYGLQRAVDEGYISDEEKSATLERIGYTQDLRSAVWDADAIIEAVPEDLQLKGQIFRKLDSMSDDIPLYSNTSGFSISAIGISVEDPSRVAGTHFYNPVPVMDIVEIIRTPHADDGIIELAEAIVEKANKNAVVIKDDPRKYGFINRCVHAMRDEAERLVREGVATEEQIDMVLKKGYNHPVGIFEFRGHGEEW